MIRFLGFLFCLFSLPTFAQSPRTGKDYAVFFYVTDFKPRWAPLPETKKEALALKNELEANFEFICEVVANPNKDAILEKISAYNKILTSRDQVMFFFSMHGHFDEMAERGYLVAADGDESDEYSTSYLSYDDLNTYLSRCPAKHVLLALDACHSGAFGIRNRPRPDAPAYSQADDCRQRITKMFQYAGRQYCSSGNKEAKTPATSLFARRLLEALRSGGENGLVRFADLEYFLSRVETPRPESGTFRGHDAGGEFVFVRKNSCSSTEDKDRYRPNEKTIYSGLSSAAEYQTLADNEKDPASALKIIEEGRRRFPNDSELLLAEINVNLKLGRHEALIDKLKQSIALEPANIGLHQTLGNVYANLWQRTTDETVAKGYFELAKSSYTRAIQLDNKNLDAHYAIGALYYNKAALLTKKLNDMDQPYSSDSMQEYDAMQEEIMHNFDLALPYFQRVEAIDANDMNTLIALKEIYVKKKESAFATEFTNRLNRVRDGSKNPISYYKL